MRIFGNDIGIIIGDSASLATGSISLNTPLPAINFIYYNGIYTSSLSTGSLGSIETKITEATDVGSRGELIFKVKDYSDTVRTGSAILRLYHTGSNNEPRVGIGFNEGDDIGKTFEIRTKKDSSEGSELVLENSRVSTSPQIGDSAGKINFVINSSSFASKYSSGSVASIDTIITETNEVGVTGHLKFSLTRNNSDLSRDLWTMGYGADPRVSGNFGSITTGSLNIVRVNSNVDDMVTLTNVNGDYISLLYSSSSIASDSTTTIDSFTTGSYTGVIYDYTLSKPSSGARTGHVMAVWDAGQVEMTDTTTPALGGGSTPSISTTLEGINDNVFTLKITSGSGYTFKSFVKRI